MRNHGAASRHRIDNPAHNVPQPNPAAAAAAAAAPTAAAAAAAAPTAPASPVGGQIIPLAPNYDNPSFQTARHMAEQARREHIAAK